MTNKLIEDVARGQYIRDLIFAAEDGIVTTFAVIAGVKGAALSYSVVLIIGFANLLADGFSMASGNYLGTKSETEFIKERAKKDGSQIENIGKAVTPIRHASITFISFAIAGSIPLLPYIFSISTDPFYLSLIFTGIALFLIGSLRKIFSNRSWFSLGFEMLIIGGFASFIAYIVGFFLKSLLK